MEDDISFIIGRAVSSFDDHLSFDLVSVLFSDLEFQSSRNQNINILEKNFVAADSGSTRIAFDQAVMSFGIFFNFVRIQAVGIIDTAGDIGQGNNLQAFIGCAFSSPGTNVAEALDSDGCIFRFDVVAFQQFQRSGDNATAGSGGTAKGAAHANSFTSDNTRFELAFDDGEFIGHPSHDLSVGVNVRSRNIHLFADNRSNLVDVATGQSFEFAFGELARINDDAAFAAAVRQTSNCAFRGHPEAQRTPPLPGPSTVLLQER